MLEGKPRPEAALLGPWLAILDALPHSHHYPGWLPPVAQAFMHSSMRKRTGQLLQVLNRAKPDVEKEKKTASGRAFVRKV